MVRTNIDVELLDDIIILADDIYNWLSDKGHPDYYSAVEDKHLVCDFVHTIDLLETVIVHFKLNAYLARLALEDLENDKSGSIIMEFWQIDIENYFASNMLELCYQLSNAWKELDRYKNKHNLFNIFASNYLYPNEIIIARHKAEHFKPEQFLSHPISSAYSILRKKYKVIGNRIIKEKAKETMHKVALFVSKAIEEGCNYLGEFAAATIGKSGANAHNSG